MESHIKIDSVFHISEEEFKAVRQHNEEREEAVDLPTFLPPLPPLIPLSPQQHHQPLQFPEPQHPQQHLQHIQHMQALQAAQPDSVTSWLIEELRSLTECPVCFDQITVLPVHCCPRGLNY